MKRLQRREAYVGLCAAIVIMLTSIMASGAPLSTAEIIARLDSTSPELAVAKSDLARTRAEYTASRALPNPRLFGSDEKLTSHGETDRERTIGVRQEIGFLWSQPAWIAAKRAAYDAALARFTEQRIQLHSDVVIGVLQLRRLHQQLSLADTVALGVQSLAERATARRKAGDVSSYDERRFQLEATQFRNRRVQIWQDYQKQLTALVQLSGLSVTDLKNTQSDYSPDIPFTNVEEAISYARQHSPRLRQADADARFTSRAVIASRLSMLPDLSLGLGQKEVSGEFRGLVVEAELEIPLFGQRRSQVNQAVAERNRARLQQMATQKSVEQEIRAAYEQWRTLEEQATEESPSETEVPLINLQQATTLYLQGELSALELIDAMRADLESLQAQAELEQTLMAARFDLVRLSGVGLDQ